MLVVSGICHPFQVLHGSHVILMQSYQIMVMFSTRTTMRLEIWPNILSRIPRAIESLYLINMEHALNVGSLPSMKMRRVVAYYLIWMVHPPSFIQWMKMGSQC